MTLVNCSINDVFSVGFELTFDNCEKSWEKMNCDFASLRERFKIKDRLGSFGILIFRIDI